MSTDSAAIAAAGDVATPTAATPAGLSIADLPANSDRPQRHADNPRVFFDIEIGGAHAGRIVMELYKQEGESSGRMEGGQVAAVSGVRAP